MGLFVPSAWHLLTSITLTANGKFDVSGISQSFRHLYIIASLSSSVAATSDEAHLFLNNDTTLGNYAHGSHQGGAVHAVAIANTPVLGVITGATSPADNFGRFMVWILEYTDTIINKDVYSLNMLRTEANIPLVNEYYINWENTAAIDRITLETDNDPTEELIANSSLQIYGVV